MKYFNYSILLKNLFISGCFINNASYHLSESNILTVNWTTNSTDCNSNLTCQIWLKDLDCETQCGTNFNSTCVPDKCTQCILNCANKTNVNVLSMTYQFPTSLKPCRKYRVVVGYKGYFIYLDPFISFRNGANITPKNISVKEEREGSHIINMFVNWQYECESHDFKVVLKDGESIKDSLDVKTLNATFNNVTACVNYSIIVIAKNENDELNGTTAHTTTEVDPSAIRDLNVTTKIENDISVVEVRWENPIYGAQCIKSYNLTAMSAFDNYSEIAECCYYKFTNVIPCADYNITIRTSSNETQLRETTTTRSSLTTLNPSPYVDQEKSITQHIRASSFIFPKSSPPIFSDVTENSFNLSVTINTEKNKCEISNYNFTCTNVTRNFNSSKVSKEPIINFDNLEPYTDYSCFVRVNNEAGWSEPGFPSNQQTQEGSKEFKKIVFET